MRRHRSRAPDLHRRPVANTSVYVAAVAVDDEERFASSRRPWASSGRFASASRACRAGTSAATLTAERFPRDPFSDDPAARLYRTGDLGRLRPDTTTSASGGWTTRWKIRGYRVELGEIEAALEQLPTVEQAVVAVHDSAKAAGEEDARQLVAYVVEASSDDGSDGAARGRRGGRNTSHDSDLTKGGAEAEAGAVYDEGERRRETPWTSPNPQPQLQRLREIIIFCGRVHRPEVVREWVETICERRRRRAEARARARLGKRDDTSSDREVR